MEQVITIEVVSGPEAVDEHKGRVRPRDLGDSDRAIERGNRTWSD